MVYKKTYPECMKIFLYCLDFFWETQRYGRVLRNLEWCVSRRPETHQGNEGKKSKRLGGIMWAENTTKSGTKHTLSDPALINIEIHPAEGWTEILLSFVLYKQECNDHKPKRTFTNLKEKKQIKVQSEDGRTTEQKYNRAQPCGL
jgi:hypothetical protein